MPHGKIKVRPFCAEHFTAALRSKKLKLQSYSGHFVHVRRWQAAEKRADLRFIQRSVPLRFCARRRNADTWVLFKYIL